MELPILSEEISVALDEAVSISDWIAEVHPGQIYQTQTNMIAGPYYGICLDHREAILLLLRHGARSSAFALFRSFYEACMRGLWSERCIDERVLAQIFRTRAFPTLERIIQQLDAVTGDKVYASFKTENWKAMCDYSHGGMLQLERWATADEISAQHPDSEVVTLLRMLNLFGLIAVWGVARLAQTDVGQHQAKVSSYVATIQAAGVPAAE